MRNTKKLDLLTEVNLMRNMMGLNSKNLLSESIIPPSIINFFVKFSTKSANDIASILGTTIGKANTLKTMFDDLDVAIKAVDDVAIKATVINIVNELDNTTIMRLADDILSDTGKGSLSDVIITKTRALKGAGATDDIIKQEVKKYLDTLLDELPNNLKNAIKTTSDNIIGTTIKGTTTTTLKTSDQIADDVFSELAGVPEWNLFMKENPSLRIEIKKTMDDLIKSGARDKDEVFVGMIKYMQRKTSPSLWKRWVNLFDNNIGPKYGKKVRLLTQTILFLILTGGLAAWSGRLKSVLGQAVDSDVDIVKEVDELLGETEEGTDNTSSTENCGGNMENFVAHLKSKGISDTTNASVTSNGCEGTIDGVGFTYEDGKWR